VDTPIAERHLALIGFMGAGKTTVGERVADRLDRPFVDLDRDIEQGEGLPIAELLERGDFRAREEAHAVRALATRPPAVIALGGGAVTSEAVRAALALHARTVLLHVEVGEAWQRASGTGRPLARDEVAFRSLYEERRPLYATVADEVAADEDGVVLAVAGVHVESGALAQLGELVPGEGPVGLVADAHVSGIHGADAQLALGARLQASHELPPGEQAKTLAVCQRLWSELTLGRAATLVALGGGSTTDAAGFVAATFLRGIPWVAVPTTLVGQVDAAIGGKTGVDLEQGKNLVGAFHWPARAIVDPGLLQTLPERELGAGMAEVVKSGLLAGEAYWELPLAGQVRRTAAFKAGVCLRDPFDRGLRMTLNLGHTFAHALEAASGYTLAHGRAVALGLTAALRLSGLPTDVVEEVLRPVPVRVDPDDAWAALKRDKKGEGVYVLLEEVGRPVVTTLSDAEARRALDELIAR
jgi:shikimate kinase / 3-dehydroquinate synthase